MTAFRFIEVEKASYPITMLCRLVGVSASGYHAWRRRPESARRRSDNALCVWIAHIHRSSRGTYGAPRIHAELRADGTRVGKKRVARLMRELGIEGAYRRRYRCITIADERDRQVTELSQRLIVIAPSLHRFENRFKNRPANAWTEASEDTDLLDRLDALGVSGVCGAAGMVVR